MKRIECSPCDATDAVLARACTHHFVIDTPNGAMARGRCKYCGAQREYPTSYRLDREDSAARILNQHPMTDATTVQATRMIAGGKKHASGWHRNNEGKAQRVLGPRERRAG